jgi:ankyrin repeat protein
MKDSQWALLHAAAEFGHIEIAEALLAKGIDIEAKDNGDCTSLYTAAFYDQTNIVQLLINKDTKVNVKTSDYGTECKKFHPTLESASKISRRTKIIIISIKT